MAKSHTSSTHDAVSLTAEQKAAVDRLTRDLPAPREMVGGEVKMLGMEALEGYMFGERTRYDTQGRRWLFLREPIDDQWQLVMSAEFFGIELCRGMKPLDRVASKEGEDAVLALVDRLCQDAFDTQSACAAHQKATRAEADEAVAPLMQVPETVATSTDPVFDPSRVDPVGAGPLDEPDLGTGPPDPEPEPEPKSKPEPEQKPKHRRW